MGPAGRARVRVRVEARAPEQEESQDHLTSANLYEYRAKHQPQSYIANMAVQLN